MDPLPSPTSLQKLRVVDLKEKLTEFGLSTSGLKADLVKRLKGHYAVLAKEREASGIEEGNGHDDEEAAPTLTREGGKEEPTTPTKVELPPDPALALKEELMSPMKIDPPTAVLPKQIIQSPDPALKEELMSPMKIDPPTAVLPKQIIQEEEDASLRMKVEIQKQMIEQEELKKEQVKEALGRQQQMMLVQQEVDAKERVAQQHQLIQAEKDQKRILAEQQQQEALRLKEVELLQQQQLAIIEQQREEQQLKNLQIPPSGPPPVAMPVPRPAQFIPPPGALSIPAALPVGATNIPVTIPVSVTSIAQQPPVQILAQLPQAPQLLSQSMPQAVPAPPQQVQVQMIPQQIIQVSQPTQQILSTPLVVMSSEPPQPVTAPDPIPISIRPEPVRPPTMIASPQLQFAPAPFQPPPQQPPVSFMAPMSTSAPPGMVPPPPRMVEAPVSLPGGPPPPPPQPVQPPNFGDNREAPVLHERPVMMGDRQIPQMVDRPPMMDDRPPMMRDRPPMMRDRPPMMDDRPPRMDDRPPRMDDRPHRMDDRPPRMDDRPPRMDDRPPRMDDRPPRMDDRPHRMGDRPPMMGDRPPMMGDRPPMMGDRPPMMGDRPPMMGDRPPPMQDRPPPMQDRPPMMDNRQPMMGNRPPMMVRPPMMGDRPPMMGDRPPMMGNRPPMMGDRPPMMGPRPPMMGDRPPMMGDRTPMMGDRPPMMGDRPPMMNDRPPMMGDRPPMMGDRPPMMGDRPQQMGQTKDRQVKGEGPDSRGGERPPVKEIRLPQALEKVLAFKDERALQIGVSAEEAMQDSMPFEITEEDEPVVMEREEEEEEPVKAPPTEKESKNKRRKKKKKKARRNRFEIVEKVVPEVEEDDTQVDVEYVQEQLDLEPTDPNYYTFAKIFEAFKLTEPEKITGKPVEKTLEKPVVTMKPRHDFAEEMEDDDFDDLPPIEEEKPKISKKKLKKLTRLSVAELKQLVSRPDLVEMHDVTAQDPRLLVHLKSTRNTVPVPRHWCFKRKYLQGKRGIEKAPFELPEYIQATGITEMRQALQEKEDQKTMKAKMREKVRPKLGKIDIDYQKLHDAFFKYQVKPKMTIHGDLYYEGKEFETKLKEKKPGNLSDDLKTALGMPVGPSTVPPPWLIAMQRYGPPPSYPSLKISGLNAPIPESCSFGYHAGGWGKPPVDETGKPLYGDVFGTQGADLQTPPEEEDVDRILWGELESESEEEDDSSEEEESEEETDQTTGLITPAGEGLVTPSGMTSIPVGVETPDMIELRKRRIEDAMDQGGETPALYQVLPEKRTNVGAAMMGSSHIYDMAGAPPRRFGEKAPGEGIEVALNPDELDMDTAAMQAKYDQTVREQQSQLEKEDLTDMVAEHAAKQKKRKKQSQDTSRSAKKYKEFKF